jgi:hypothetical protein
MVELNYNWLNSRGEHQRCLYQVFYFACLAFLFKKRKRSELFIQGLQVEEPVSKRRPEPERYYVNRKLIRADFQLRQKPFSVENM